jgi:hypothetical protein
MPEGEVPAREWLIVDQRLGCRRRARPAGRRTALPARAGYVGGRRNRRVHHRHGSRGRESHGRGSGRRPSTRRPPTRNKRTARSAPRCGPLSLWRAADPLLGGLLCRKPGNGALPTIVGAHERRRVATRRHTAVNQSAPPADPEEPGAASGEGEPASAQFRPGSAFSRFSMCAITSADRSARSAAEATSCAGSSRAGRGTRPRCPKPRGVRCERVAGVVKRLGLFIAALVAHPLREPVDGPERQRLERLTAVEFRRGRMTTNTHARAAFRELREV